VTLFCLAIVIPLLLPDAARERLWKPVGDRLWAHLDRLQDRWMEAERRKPKNIVFQRRWKQFGQELEAEINPLPIAEARRRAETLLSDPSRFHILKAPPTPKERSRLESLPPHLRAFFEMYQSVYHLKGGLSLSRCEIEREIEPYLASRGVVVIGSTGLEHEHLDAGPADETIYEVDAVEGCETEEALLSLTRFSSIFHCLLYYDRRETLLFSR